MGYLSMHQMIKIAEEIEQSNNIDMSNKFINKKCKRNHRSSTRSKVNNRKHNGRRKG